MALLRCPRHKDASTEVVALQNAPSTLPPLRRATRLPTPRCEAASAGVPKNAHLANYAPNAAALPWFLRRVPRVLPRHRMCGDVPTALRRRLQFDAVLPARTVRDRPPPEDVDPLVQLVPRHSDHRSGRPTLAACRSSWPRPPAETDDPRWQHRTCSPSIKFYEASPENLTYRTRSEDHAERRTDGLASIKDTKLPAG